MSPIKHYSAPGISLEPGTRIATKMLISIKIFPKEIISRKARGYEPIRN